MTDQIKQYFQSDRSYSAGLELVMRFSPRMALKKQLSILPADNYLLGVIHEELRQLCAIPRDQFSQIMAAPVLKKELQQPFNADAITGEPSSKAHPGSPAEKKASRKK